MKGFFYIKNKYYVFYRFFLLFNDVLLYFYLDKSNSVMKTKFTILFVLFVALNTFAQIDTQKRFQSDTRKYYVWNNQVQKYELKETEYEHSIIDIREIGSKTNGYIVISMVDNGISRLHHGSIKNFAQTADNEGTWLLQSKNMKAKLTYNPQENTMTYLYEADNDRYNRLIIFNVSPDELQTIKTVAKVD